ncbi:MAG TPA: glucokinase [Beijerinckiaceae bacterium]|jgi:glucokinase
MTLAVSYPLLVGDIGGTNARFGILAAPGGALALLPRTRTSGHRDLIAAIRAALDDMNLPKPRAALLAVAARVEAPVVDMTNAGWTVDAQAVGAAFGLDSVRLVNDFVPVAAALNVLGREEGQLLRLGPDGSTDAGARLVVGPGTGLGAAALLPVGERWAIHSTEAGHTDFGPAHPDEAALWPFIERVADRVTAEAVLSGPGLLRLYRALARARNAPAACVTPEEVSAAGLGGGDALSLEALHLFGRLLGRFAGDLALTFGATAVYIAGGIGPKIAAVLSAGGFRAAFERKAPFRHWMEAVPTFLIADPDPALTGLTAILAEPDRFVFRSAGWRREE